MPHSSSKNITMRSDLINDGVTRPVLNVATQNSVDKNMNQQPVSIMNHLGEKVFINLQDVQKTPVPRANMVRVDSRQGSRGKPRDTEIPVSAG